jgi:hypothetical protein
MADFQLIFSIGYSKGLTNFTVTYQKKISPKEINTCYLPIYLYTIWMRIKNNTDFTWIIAKYNFLWFQCLSYIAIG